VSGAPRLLASSSLALVMATAPGAEAALPPAPPPAATSSPKPAAGLTAEELALPFEEVARRAANARDAEAPDEAIKWYRRAVRLRPAWDEGWWYLGTLHYGADHHAQARDAFQRFLALKPDAGPAWALRGLCEFELKQYDDALRHLTKGLSLGSVGNVEIRKVVYYHLALLRIRAGQFELAVEPLRSLARTEPETPALLDACGLLVLRDPRLPSEIPAERRELVRAAGGAAYAGFESKTDEMRKRFDALLQRYPDVLNLHYGYGVFMMDVDQEKAVAAHLREIEMQPGAVLPRLEIAFAHERRGEYEAALPYADQAARLAPGLFAARYALGRALVDLGQVSRAITELEEAVRLAPESPEVRFALVRAYHAAGRTEDVERERAVFKKLEAQRKGPSDVPGFARDLTAPPPPTP